VSCTSPLHHGALGAWCAERLTGVDELIDEVQTVADRRSPVRPSGDVNSEHWTVSDGALRQRMAFFACHEPPYTALLGVVRAGLLSNSMIDVVAGLWPTHRDLPPEDTQKASQLRPTPTGWHDLAPGPHARPGDIPARPQGSAEHVIAAFHRWQVSYLARHAAPGSGPAPRAVEENLARACWVLAGYDSAYRGGRLPAELAVEHEHLRNGRDESEQGDSAIAQALLAAAPRIVVADLVALVERLSNGGIFDILRALAGNPDPGQSLGYAQPVFVAHFSGADLVVGDTLIDIKTIVSTRDRAAIAQWLCHILTQAWLDTQNHYGIRNVGLMLARHGELVSWPLEGFAEVLVGRRGRVPAVRRSSWSTPPR
jgi:hypothetical protein